MEDYLKVNRDSWDKRAEKHYDSEFYDNESFVQGRNSLNSIELDILPDLKGKRVLHLQCHFGQDTISMARMGAEAVGVDLSPQAISFARQLNNEVKESATFVESDVYSLPDHLQGSFDVVFTSYGTIGWLPDLEKWADIVNHFLAPGGAFVMADFHPVVWMFDNHFKEIQYSYFKKEAIVEKESSYTENSQDLEVTSVSWNHSMDEILGALLGKGLKLEVFNEHDFSPYPCFANVVHIDHNRWQIEGLQGKIPMVYAFRFSK